MKRYVTNNAGANESFWWDAKGTDHLARTLIEAERAPRDTGILNASGMKIYSVDEMQPIGFIHPRKQAD